MLKNKKQKNKGSLAPLTPALVAGGALIGAVIFNSTAESNGADPSPFLHPHLNVSQVFSPAATQTKLRKARLAQTEGYVYYCNPYTAEGLDACCYYYGYYCYPQSSEHVFAGREEEDGGAGFAGTGKPLDKPTGGNFLL